MSLLGPSPESAARASCTVFFVLSILLAAWVTARFSHLAVGLLAGAFLATEGFYRGQALGGMETALAVCLGLGVVAAIQRERPVAAGVLLGLAIINKLDAGLLALAVAAAWLIGFRKFPRKVCLVSLAVVLPWAIFATWYFGSPIPQSLVAKLDKGARDPFDRAWVVAFYGSSARPLLLAGALGFFALLRFLSPAQRAAAFVLGFWFTAHAAALSTLSLGAPYPWYLGVLIPPPVILAAALAGRAFSLPGGLPWKLLGVGVVLCLAVAAEGPVRATVNELATDNQVKLWEAFDHDRRMAGLFLSQHADPEEVVAAAYGWVAFEARGLFNDTSKINSKVMRSPVTYRVDHGYPVDTGAHPPSLGADGLIPLATFNLASDLFPGYSWFTVFGATDSAIARSGARYLQYRLFELSPAAPGYPEQPLNPAQLEGIDLVAHPPSGATFTVPTQGQPAHVVFTPGFRRTVPADKTDGVTFQVWSEGERLFERHLLPGETGEPVLLELPSRGAAQVRVAFVTLPGPRNDPDHDRALWRAVKVIVGDGGIDPERITNQRLRAEWKRRNVRGAPTATP